MVVAHGFLSIRVRGRRRTSSSQSSAFAIRSNVSSRGGRVPRSSRATADCVVPQRAASSDLREPAPGALGRHLHGECLAQRLELGLVGPPERRHCLDRI